MTGSTNATTSSAWPVIGDKKAALTTRVFRELFQGLEDQLMRYNLSRGALEANIDAMIDFYNRRSTDQRDPREGTPRPRRLTPSLPWDWPFSWDRINKRQVAIRHSHRIRSCGNAAPARTDLYERARFHLNPTSSSTTVPTSFSVDASTTRECRLLRGWHGLRQALLVSDKRHPHLILLKAWQRSILPRWTYEKTEPRDGA